ncbi:uncharacterized protein LOC108671122 [Hyalella azteca]|uniref:small monomeric GTPase n=1 Tax=Hyalella azteca TaxID=294128 RepID=A0A8B7NKB3_HYAAZ|nr:uncharacterized protein LOC108671122 [Hyalella azteca]
MVQKANVVAEISLKHGDCLTASSQDSECSNMYPEARERSIEKRQLQSNSVDSSDTNSNTNSMYSCNGSYNGSYSDAGTCSLSTDSSGCSNNDPSHFVSNKFSPLRQLDSIFERQMNASDQKISAMNSLNLAAVDSRNISSDFPVKHQRSRSRQRSLKYESNAEDIARLNEKTKKCYKNFDFAQYPVRSSTNETAVKSSWNKNEEVLMNNLNQSVMMNGFNVSREKCLRDNNINEDKSHQSSPAIQRNYEEKMATNFSSSFLAADEDKTFINHSQVRRTKIYPNFCDGSDKEQRRRRHNSLGTTCAAKINVLLLGAKGVGKSALAVRFLTHRFIGEYHSAVTIVYRHSMVVDSRERVLEIVDSSAKPGECSLHKAEISAADSVAVVYSVTDAESFSTARRCLQRVHEIRDERPPIALMANKLDLDHCREITRTEGEELAEEFNAHYAEVSAAESSSDIEPTFLYLVQKAVGCSASSCHLKMTRESSPKKSLASFRKSLSPSSIRRFAQFRNENYESSLHRTVSAITNLNYGPFSSSHVGGECRNQRSSRAKRKGDPVCSTRCTSYDDSKTLCQMEILDSDGPNSSPNFSKNSTFSRRKITAVKKIRPSMPTGRTKRREKCSSLTKNWTSRITSSDDLYVPSSKKYMSNLVLSSSGSSRLALLKDETTPAHSLLNYCTRLSRSVDQNLQKVDHPADSADHSIADMKIIAEEKPLSLLQRGRSFIQEARDKHWRDKDLRLSLRNFGSRTDVSKTEKFLSAGPTPRPRTVSSPKKLPTGGSTWLVCSEEDNIKSRDFAKNLMVPWSKENPELLSTSEKISRSEPATANICADDIHIPGTPEQHTNSGKSTGYGGERFRKFAVFSRTFGNFWSRSSMPDLPKASSNIYDKFDSFKKSLKKRSV